MQNVEGRVALYDFVYPNIEGQSSLYDFFGCYQAKELAQIFLSLLSGSGINFFPGAVELGWCLGAE